MPASQSPQLLFSPPMAPSLVLASMSQVWSHCSRKVAGATASLLLSPSTPVLSCHYCCRGRYRKQRPCMLSFHLSKDSSAGTQP